MRRPSVIRGKRFWEIISKAYLQHLYWELRLSRQQIAKIIGCNSLTPLENAMKLYGIPARKNGGFGAMQNSPNWKGDSVQYNAAHIRLNRLFGKPRKCVDCGTTTAKRYDWANLSGSFEDPNDYVRLCRSCHLKLDYATGQRTR